MDTERARKLRHSATRAERRLWAGLRDRRLEGLKFRRQQQLGPYYVDFFCIEARLIIEADGTQHYDEDEAWYDYWRTKWLERAGYRVVRFPNRAILQNTRSVLGDIAVAAKERMR